MYQNQPPAENVIIHAKPHWVILVLPAALTGLGFLCTLCTLLTAFTDPPPPQEPPPEEMIQCMVFCTGFIFLVALVWVLRAIKAYIDSDFTLTNHRVIYETGGFRRKTLDVFLRNIDSVYVERSILGSLLGYGTMVIVSNYVGPWQVKIAGAEKIRQHIQEQIARQ